MKHFRPGKIVSAYIFDNNSFLYTLADLPDFKTKFSYIQGPFLQSYVCIKNHKNVKIQAPMIHMEVVDPTIRMVVMVMKTTQALTIQSYLNACQMILPVVMMPMPGLKHLVIYF